jgi:hypothetical protein
MNNLRTVVNEIAALEDVLLADDAPGALSGNSNTGAIRTRVKLHGGRGYVFAYNTSNATASATFTWNTTPGTVTVNAEGRTLAASGRAFTDSFGPYQAHVYVIGSGGTGGTSGTGGTGGTGNTPSAPSVTFVNPAAGATVSGTTTVTLSGSGGSGSGYTYRVTVDGTTVYTGTNPTFSWNTTTASNGSHALGATVTDSGSQSGTATRSVTVSNTTTTPTTTPPPPTGNLAVAITAPTSGATVSGTNWAVIWVNGAAAGSKTYTLSVAGQTVGSSTSTSSGPVSIPWNTASVANGSRVLTATVRDAAGGVGSVGRTVNVSNAGAPAPPPPPPPLAVTFTSPAAGATVSNTVTVGMSASGGSGYTYRLAIDGGQVSTAASYSWNTTSVANGAHTLTATVTDSGGRTASASRTVTVSNTAPAPTPSTGSLRVFITQPTGGATVSGTAWVVMWVEGTSGSSNSFTLSVDGVTVGSQTTSARGPVTLPWITRNSSNGSHTLRATVRDATGKTGSTTATVTVRN